MYNLKRMKKLFAILTVLVFLAGIASTGLPKTALAASNDNEAGTVDVKKLTSDITDKDVKDAVLRLAAFGIVNGMEDGKYHPDEVVTREQFAKILVTSLKMDAAAKAAMGRSSFKDVEASRWSAGYINVAAGQGLVKGYPDGTFKPDAKVSYAEAITMLVRALGYKDSFLPGAWPGNYLAKAAEKEITKYVKFSDPTGGATRGDVAILVNNTLDAKVVKVDTYEAGGTKYYESDKTLLEDKLNITKYEDVRIIANRRIDDGLDEEEVRVKFLKDSEDDKYDEGEEKEFDMIYGLNVENVLGEEVTIYLNDDDEVVYAEREYDDKPYFDYIEGVVFKSDKKTVDKLSLVKADDDYAFEKDAVIYVMDGDEYKTVEYDEVTDASKLVGKVGKFVLKNRKIVWAEIMSSGETQPWMIVTKNDNGMLYGIVADDDEYDIDLREGEDYDGVIVLDLEGNILSVDDIEEGNLVYIQKQDIGGDDYAVVRVVKDNIVEGKLSSVKDDRIKIDDKEIKVVKYNLDGTTYEAYYSVNDGEDIYQYILENSDVSDDMEDADEETIVAYTDAVGRIAYFVTKAEATSGYMYGIVTKVYADGDKLKIFTVTNDGTGDEITYNMEDDDNLTENGAFALNQYGQKTKDKATVVEGAIVKFKLNKDGEIAEDEIYVMDPKNVWRINSTNDFGKDYLPKAQRYEAYTYDKDDPSGANIKPSGTAKETYTFSVDDNVKIIDAEGYVFNTTGKKYKIADNICAYWDDTDDFSEAKWEDLKDANGIDGYFYVFTDDDNKTEAKGVIFIGKGSGAAANDEMGIYVIDTWMKGGDRYVEYQSYDGDVEERKLDDEDMLYANDEHPYIGKVKSDGTLEIIEPGKSEDEFDIYYGKVIDRDASSLEVGPVVKVAGLDSNDNFIAGEKSNDTTFRISSKTIVYEEDNKKSTSNIRKGDVIIFVVEKGSNVRVIERLIDSEKAEFDKKLEETTGTTPEEETTTTDIVTYINTTVKAGTDKIVKITLPADNTDVYKVVAFKADGSPANSGVSTLVSKEITATELGIANPGAEEATYVVRVYKLVGANEVEISSKVVKNTDVTKPDVISAQLTQPNVVGATATATINNQIEVVAVQAGTAGNNYTVELVNDSASQSLSVAFNSGTKTVTVKLATDEGNITSTLEDVVDAVNADPFASTVVKLSVSEGVDASKIANVGTGTTSGGQDAKDAKITLVFSETMKADTTATIKIEGKTYIGSVSWSSDSKTAVITISADQFNTALTSGDEVESISLTDLAGNIVNLTTPVELQ
ncbi:S-layer homology domain-containing protein [Thermoanaerobacterium sp. DL9XJH110]|uniref:S-layer homology domain-containing protein n=1 Tax=Thermoanaerobacterium sp. DL9XJH110 TaxID=3386643 RepID=UPI003BB6260B